MRKLFIFIAVVVALGYWTRDWVRSGRMDAALRDHKNESWAPNTVRLLGEASRLSNRPREAAYYFEWYLQTYPPTEHTPAVLWHLGQAYEDLEEKKKALELYSILKSSYSATDYGRLGSSRYAHIKY